MVERTLLFANKSMIPFSIGLAIVLGGLIVYLYRAERSMIRRRAGRILTALRIALILILLVMLTEPIISITTTLNRKGTLIVMVDNSRSMQIPDLERPAWERLRLADALGLLPKGVHRSDLRTSQESIAALGVQTDAAAKRWNEFAEVMALGVLEDKERAERVNESLAAAEALRKSLAALLDGLNAYRTAEAPLPGDVVLALERLRVKLSEGTTLLDEMVRELSSGEFQARPTVGRLRGINQSFTRLGALWGQALATMRETVVKHDALIAETALAAAPEVATRVDAASRLDLAGRMLSDGRVDFLSRVGDRYQLQAFLFARRASELPTSSDNASGLPVRPPASAAEALYTDLSDGLSKALSKAEREEIAGVVLLSDGRFNHGEDPLKVARALGSRGIPVTTVLVGSETPPRDVAVVKVQGADFVHDKDAVDMSVLVKAEGFEGQELSLSVREKGQAVVEKKFTVPPGGRAAVNLSFVPEGKGQHNYVVTVPVQPREVFVNNNERPFAVSVIDKKIRLLLADGGPRWEYRYLKNALLRDKRLDFSYILFDPLTTSQSEAQRAVDAYPHKREDLFAFDTLILGDVNPAVFTPEDLANLEAFVNHRGGTLIVVAGKDFMPAAYAKTAFASVLPVTPAETGPAPEEMPVDGFPVLLTAEAKQSPIFRLVPDEKENVETWAALPKMLWYAPVESVKPGAVVWAYASLAGGESSAESAKRPVILSQAYGLGRVFYVGADETWRWRYKVADKYLYQFWGQVILWATSGKLPVGTERVRLGTDKFEYVDGEDVIVRARVLSDKMIPVADAMVSAKLVRKTDDAEVAQTRLDYLSESGGHYEGKFHAVGMGSYVVKLSVAGTEQESVPVVTDVEVKEAPTRELVELSADAATMREIAERSGGRAFTLDELGRVPDALRPLSWKQIEPREIPLWDHWLLLTAFCLVVTAEWVIRKVEGLL